MILCFILSAVVVGFDEAKYNISEEAADQMVCVSIMEGEIQEGSQITLVVSAADGTTEGEGIH